MTEDEAKTRWCPFVRLADEVKPALPPHNRVRVASDPSGSAGIPTTSCCIASACMAWRWMEGPNALRYDNEAGTSNRIEPSERRGFCGIAGMPSE